MDSAPPTQLAKRPTQSATVHTLTWPQKAAVVIALLGADTAGPIVEKMDDKQLRRFMSAFEALRQVPREVMLGAVADFIAGLNARRGGFRGGTVAARELAESLFDGDKAARLFGTPPPSAPETSTDIIWARLKDRKIADIAAYLATQRGEVVSIILSQFSTGVVGEILSELPENIALSCVAQMPRDNHIGQRTIDAIAEMVQIEFLAETQAADKQDSVGFVSEVMGILPRERREAMLEALEKSNPEQAERIRNGMMTFEDLPACLPTTAIPIIFRDFEMETLLKALKAGSEQDPATIEFLLANISQRMAGQYKEDLEELGELSQKQGDSAISSLMGFISKLDKEGRITLIKSKPTETD